MKSVRGEADAAVDTESLSESKTALIAHDVSGLFDRRAGNEAVEWGGVEVEEVGEVVDEGGVVVGVVGIGAVTSVGVASSVRPEVSAVSSAELMDIGLAGGVSGENAGARAESSGFAHCLRVGLVVLGVGVVVVVVIVVVLVVDASGTVVVVGADCVDGEFRQRRKRLRRRRLSFAIFRSRFVCGVDVLEVLGVGVVVVDMVVVGGGMVVGAGAGFDFVARLRPLKRFRRWSLRALIFRSRWVGCCWGVFVCGVVGFLPYGEMMIVSSPAGSKLNMGF